MSAKPVAPATWKLRFCHWGAARVALLERVPSPTLEPEDYLVPASFGDLQGGIFHPKFNWART